MLKRVRQLAALFRNEQFARLNEEFISTTGYVGAERRGKSGIEGIVPIAERAIGCEGGECLCLVHSTFGAYIARVYCMFLARLR